MTSQEILDKVRGIKNARYFWIDFQTNKAGCLSAAARKAGHTCYKSSHVQVKKGIAWKNTQVAQDRYANGAAHGKTTLRMSDDPRDKNTVYYNDDTGEISLRLYPQGNEGAINERKVTYIVDGVEMSYDDAVATGYFTPSGIKGLTEHSPIIYVKLSNITNIY